MELTFDAQQIIIAALSLFSGGAMIKIIQGYWKERQAQREGYHSDGIAFRKNLISRIQDLEQKEKDNHKKILELTKENAELRVEIRNLLKKAKT